MATAAADLPGARAALAETLAAREAAGAAHAADREQLQARTAEADTTRVLLADLTEQLTAARGEDRDLPARIARLTAEAELCEAAVTAETDEVRARTTADTARRAAEERAEQAGFTDLLDAAAALLDQGRLAVLDRRIDEHDRSLSVAQAALAAPDLADLGPRPDLAALTRPVRAGDPAARRGRGRTRPRPPVHRRDWTPWPAR